MLVTERPGRMRIATPDGKLSAPLQGVPKVAASGQGGLHDVVLDRNFAQNKTIYFCFAEPAGGGARTAMARATLGDGKLDDVKVIFQQDGPLSSGRHFGCRIVQTPDNNLFLTHGRPRLLSRTRRRTSATTSARSCASRRTARCRKDNPFVGRADAKPEIWSYGHRNSQGAALHPTTGKLWEHEHGPRGGDEVNIPEKGKNYGWPVIGYGIDYNGAKIHESTVEARHGAADQALGAVDRAVRHGVLSRAICSRHGRATCSSARWPTQILVRLTLDGEKVTGEERLLQGIARAHPRRARRAGRRALSRHRQQRRPHSEGRPGEVRSICRRPPRRRRFPASCPTAGRL